MVYAEDGDSGDYATVTYSLSGQGLEYFTIDPNTVSGGGNDAEVVVAVIVVIVVTVMSIPPVVV